MSIVIKKWVKYLLVITGIFIFIPLLLYIVVQIPGIQTMIVRKVTNTLSENLRSEISIRRVDYRFFNKLALSEVLFLDRNRDTLLYTRKLSAGIRKVDIKNRVINLGRVDLASPDLSLIADSTGKMNLEWYLEHLKGSGKDSSGREMDLKIDRIDIDKGRFSMINRKNEKKEDSVKLDFSDLAIGNINGIIEDFHILNDTISFRVFNLSFNEKSGFIINKMNSDVTLSGGNILLGPTLISSDTTILNFEKLAD